MKVENMDWMDWLHRMREEEFEACGDSGTSVSDYLKKVNREGRDTAEKLGLNIADFRKIQA